jgi:hypothetical protein
MKQTAVEWLVEKVLQTNHLKAIFEDEINQAKEMEKQQQGYSDEEVLSILEFITDNTIETNNGWQMNGVVYSNKEILQQFKNK